MKKPFAVLAAPALMIAFASAASAVTPPDAASRTTDLGGVEESERASLRERTVEIAQCALDAAFAPGIGKDPHLARVYRRLDDMLEQLPAASLKARSDMAQESYKIRLRLEANKYNYSYAMAAQAVATAASTATTASVHGHQWSGIYTGDKDAVSYALTRDAVDGAEIWHNKRGLAKMECL